MVRRAMAFPELDAPAVDWAIRTAIASQMQERGYQPETEAQIRVRFTFDLKELIEIDRHTGFRSRDGRSSEGRIVAVLLIHFDEAASGTNVWRIEAEGPWPQDQSDSEKIDRMVRGALRSVPESSR